MKIARIYYATISLQLAQLNILLHVIGVRSQQCIMIPQERPTESTSSIEGNDCLLWVTILRIPPTCISTSGVLRGSFDGVVVEFSEAEGEILVKQHVNETVICLRSFCRGADSFCPEFSAMRLEYTPQCNGTVACEAEVQLAPFVADLSITTSNNSTLDLVSCDSEEDKWIEIFVDATYWNPADPLPALSESVTVRVTFVKLSTEISDGRQMKVDNSEVEFIVNLTAAANRWRRKSYESGTLLVRRKVVYFVTAKLLCQFVIDGLRYLLPQKMQRVVYIADVKCHFTVIASIANRTAITRSFDLSVVTSRGESSVTGYSSEPTLLENRQQSSTSGWLWVCFSVASITCFAVASLSLFFVIRSRMAHYKSGFWTTLFKLTRLRRREMHSNAAEMCTMTSFPLRLPEETLLNQLSTSETDIDVVSHRSTSSNLALNSLYFSADELIVHQTIFGTTKLHVVRDDGKSVKTGERT